MSKACFDPADLFEFIAARQEGIGGITGDFENFTENHEGDRDTFLSMHPEQSDAVKALIETVTKLGEVNDELNDIMTLIDGTIGNSKDKVG